jgi:endonuclease-3
MELVEKIKEVYRRLKELYPIPYKPKRSPIEQAVFTVLSQNTTDKNAGRCLENLKALTRGELLRLSELSREEVIKAIKACGMYNQKYQALVSLVKEWPNLELRLRELPSQEAIELLKSFPFIGPKSARVILTFAFGKNTFPIDTHCRRVLRRLAIFPSDWSLEKISRFMEENFSGEFNRELHYNLIRLGREVCKARKPECERCPLKEICGFYREKGRDKSPTPSQP